MKKETTKQQNVAPKTAVSREDNKAKVRKLTLASMLTAIVVVLALLGTAVRIGAFTINLSLVPIVIGAAMLGPWYGAWFGLVNAVVILISGDALLFWIFEPVGTVITVLFKGILSGLASGFVYYLVSKKNKYAAVVLAAIVCPVVNTGVFLLGCRIFFWKHLPAIANMLNVKLKTNLNFVLSVLIGLNFPIELAINIILAPVIARILGFSEDKNTALTVYGTVLSVLGSAVLIYAMFLIRDAYLGLIPEIQRPGLRYAIMALISNLVQVCGFAMLAMGLFGKRSRQSLEK